jgi:exosome complex component RRP42
MEPIDEIKKSNVKNLLQNNERIDRRGMLDYRPIEITKNYIDTGEGSALVKLGETKALSVIKFDVVEPFSDKPNEGVISTNSEMLSLSSERFESGPPGEKSIELARVVDRGIRSAEIIDTKDMNLGDGKVLGLFIDLYLLDYDGNYLDASALATMAALRNTMVPTYEDGVLIRDNMKKKLKLKGDVFMNTFVKIDDKILLDPILDEEVSMDCRLSVGIYENNICSLQKNGRGEIKRNEFEYMIDASLEKYKELKKIIEI